MTEKQVYILLTNTGSLLTKLIKLYTKKPYNHSSIAFDQHLSEVYSFGRKTARNPFIGGFVKEDVRMGLFKHADCAIYSITVSESQLQNLRHYLQEIEAQQKQYRYNFLGLFGVMFNRPLKRKNAFFCSQFVAYILNKSTIMKFEKPLGLIAPYDLQCVSNLHLVYEGKLKDYQNENKAEMVCYPVTEKGVFSPSLLYLR
ncbi:hypothetical protein [Neobacillus sp. CF12]|uniref:hypothetical protein n=1 Tax=Neobacillus sp. CF12 TaxID=3055864 RepID=UPI0025A169A0|nr:hypothetical protein [Neobacillus sp. CF12]MDM5327145.1 hypothetical protein [Neobacillus sp. CF12]